MVDTADLTRALTRISQRVERTAAHCAAQNGISAAQAQLLQQLTGAAPTINELAASLGLDKSSASGLVDRAQAKGLVRRVPSQLDRRSVRVRLTGEGRALAGAISTLRDRQLEAMLEPLAPAARQQLAAVLAQLLGD